MTPKTPPPPWFSDAVLAGLQALQALCLDRAPAADVIARTATAWVGALWPVKSWEAERDRPRLRTAFASLCGQVRQWPSPRQLLDHLPTPGPPPTALPSPEREAARARAARRGAEVLAELQRRCPWLRFGAEPTANEDPTT